MSPGGRKQTPTYCCGEGPKGLPVTWRGSQREHRGYNARVRKSTRSSERATDRISPSSRPCPSLRFLDEKSSWPPIKVPCEWGLRTRFPSMQGELLLNTSAIAAPVSPPPCYAGRQQAPAPFGSMIPLEKAGSFFANYKKHGPFVCYVLGTPPTTAAAAPALNTCVSSIRVTSGGTLSLSRMCLGSRADSLPVAGAT